jgi:hypothetical protein
VEQGSNVVSVVVLASVESSSASSSTLTYVSNQASFLAYSVAEKA